MKLTKWKEKQKQRGGLGNRTHYFQTNANVLTNYTMPPNSPEGDS